MTRDPSVFIGCSSWCLHGRWDVGAFLWHKFGAIVPPPPSISQAGFLLGVLTWILFSEASLLTRLLAVVSPTQIIPLLVITEQQIFTSLLNLGETFSRTPWLVMSSAILQHWHTVLRMNNFPEIFSLFHVFVYLCLGGRSQAGDHLGSYEGIPLAQFNLFYSGGKINICIPPVDQPPPHLLPAT